MQAFSLFSVLFLALIVYHKMAFNAVISRLSAIYNHREQTLIIIFAIGAGIGGVLSNIWGIKTILVSTILLTFVIVMMIKEYR